MKKIIVLIAINLLLLGIAMQVTNEDAVLKEIDFEIGKTYVEKNNKQNKIVLFGDYSVEITDCIKDDCKTNYGSFKIDNNSLQIIIDDETKVYQIKDKNSFKDDKRTYILE